MKVKDIMTRSPACCGPESSLQAAAKLMVDHDCGEIPVVDAAGKPIGVITDRDICCRAVAEGSNPLTMNVGECMSSPCITVTESQTLSDCLDVLERHQIRRAPVVDESGRCIAIVSQADVVRYGTRRDAAELVRAVSQPNMSSWGYA
jgi:CBS domain-containing protein